jgi:ABC-type multidrug transport system fused ATPase/permease subunit
MSKFQVLSRLMKKYRLQLIITYLLFSLEMAGTLLRPFFIGHAINDLLHQSYRGIAVLLGVHLAWMVVGVIRHRFDTRTYTAIYTSLVTHFLSRRFGAKEVSKLTAHSNLAKEFVDFLEYDLVYVIEAMYNIFGSLLLLFFYDKAVVGVCLLFLIPVMALSYFYGKKMRRLTQQKNDELEKQVDIITSRNKKAIHQHYNLLRNWQVRISDQDAWNFGMMELVVILLLGTSLFLTGKTGAATLDAGALVGIFSYIQKFIAGLDTIPYTVQRVSALSDITRRIELQEADFDEEPPLRVATPAIATVALKASA